MSSRLEISASALGDNFAAIRDAAQSEVLAVIKANAYGHGAALCAPVLARAGARWLGVTDAAEGVAVRAALRNGDFADGAVDLLVMVGFDPNDAEAVRTIVAHRMTAVVWLPAQVEALNAAARDAQRTVDIHVEIDTGMNRQGVKPGGPLDVLLTSFQPARHLRITGVMGHLACAEVRGAASTADARDAFERAVTQFTAHDVRPLWLHLENTSGVDNGECRAYIHALAQRTGAQPMVRCGLATYGYALPLENCASTPSALQQHLRPALRWTCRVLDVRDVAAGETIGYGASFTAPHGMRVALLPVGYADGFRREASSGMPRNGAAAGWVLVRGRRAPVVGRVSMNLLCVDVTGIAGLAAGEQAVLLGEGVTAEDHAAWAGSIPYEILCSLRGERVLVR